MKPLETIFWLGTAGVLYMAANKIVKNVAKDVVKDVFKETEKRSDHSRLLVVVVTQSMYPPRKFALLQITPFYFLFNR